MNCPVCNRNLVVSLSICPACGTMMNDSVREEMIAKKKSQSLPGPVKSKVKSHPPEQQLLKGPPKTNIDFSKSLNGSNKPLSEKKAVSETRLVLENKKVMESKKEIEHAHPAKKQVTSKLDVKHTSPTLIEFQKKEKGLPEWRLELKNAVRQKLQKAQLTEDEPELFPTPRVINRTRGATALKPEIIEQADDRPVLHENPTVQNALLRIEQSRQRFSSAPEIVAVCEDESGAQKSKKDFPFYIASRSNEVAQPKTDMKSPAYTVAKPKLISTIPAENFKRDTNKLPPLPVPARVSTSFDRETDIEIKTEAAPEAVKTEQSSLHADIIISPQKTDDFVEAEDLATEENEDLAPFAMRFNAGLFDLIIGGFASLILLAPFILLGGEWFTTAGLLAFLATCAIVMFIYMTTAVGLFGKTFGMRMFALEIIDIEENDYPSFHQAAVNSAVYLLSLALGGSGFLTVLFTDEKRAVHDIVSGTLMVRDFQEETA